MTTRDQLIRARIGILAMAAELKNVARACKLAGVSRSQFYAMKKAYEIRGKEGLAPQVRRKPEMPNRTPAETEARIMRKTLENPMVSYARLAELMRVDGVGVTPTMVRYVWQRLGLSTRAARLQWVKKKNGRLGWVKTKSVGNVLEVGPAPCMRTPTSPPSSASVTDSM